MTVVVGLVIALVSVNLATADEDLSARAFMVLWIAISTLVIYWYLFRFAYDLRFDTEDFYWRSPLRSGSLPLHELRRIRVRNGTDGIIESANGNRLHVLAQKGFGQFCLSLASQVPSLDIRI